MDWILRLASDKDVGQLEELIPLSVRTLQEAYYSSAQMEAALGPVFGVDRQLITDGTYFVVECAEQIVGCGGWSKRESLFGSYCDAQADMRELDPERDASRIRAFFVHPAWARRGIGRGILSACEAAIKEVGFHRVELVATLSGEPLYAAFGFVALQRYEIILPNQLGLPVVRMGKRIE